MAVIKYDTAAETLARYVPAGQVREELLALIRIGVIFGRQQQVGRRPGFLHHFIAGIVERIGSPATFERLLAVLELEATHRNLDGEFGHPVEIVNRVWELVTYHHPQRGRLQVTFGTLRNILTAVKKTLFTDTPKP